MRGPTAETDWIILGRHLAGEASAAERDQVRAWTEQDPALGPFLETIGQVGPADDPVDVEAALRQVKSRFGEARVIGFPARRRTAPWIGLAAALALIVGAAFLWRLLRPSPLPPSLTYLTGVGQTDSIRLADGATAVLGPASRLEVPAGYGAPDRTVSIEGQALFDVPHDPAHRFLVRAGGAEIVDLGTRFMVHAGNEEVRVMVESGSVVLQDTVRRAARALTLKAGEVGTLGARDATPVPGQRNEADLAWLHGQLIFDNAPMSRVREDLRRWFGLELVLADSSLANRHVSARFTRESKDQVLEVLQLALGASIDRKGDTAVVRLGAPSRHPPK